jgi:predicted lysophospholipase L1 biosynthesis ABC-type transport system permease subunit
MIAYEFARLVPAEWTYPPFGLAALFVLAAAIAILPLGLVVRSARTGFVPPPLPDTPSLPATPVKPRLA